MIETKSRLVLSILANEAKNGNYKVFEISDIIMSMPRHYRIEKDAVKNILNHLERQDIISIKYEEDDTYCLAVLPYGFEVLENKGLSKISAKQKTKISFSLLFLTFFASFFGGFLGAFLCILFFK